MILIYKNGKQEFDLYHCVVFRILTESEKKIESCCQIILQMAKFIQRKTFAGINFQMLAKEFLWLPILSD